MNELEYLRSFVHYDNKTVSDIEKESEGRDDIQPFVEPETGRFLSFLVKLTGAELVLEFGTGIGNSSIWIGEALKERGGRLITVDNHPRTRAEAEVNIKKAGLDDIVEMRFADAEKEAEKLLSVYRGKFDIVFQDCGKYLYPLMIDSIYDLTRDGGLIVADDTLFRANPDVRKNLGRYTDEYNRMIYSREDLYSSMLPVGHGLTMSIKKNKLC